MAKTRNFESDDIRTTVEKKERQRRMTFAVEEKSGMKRRISRLQHRNTFFICSACSLCCEMERRRSVLRRFDWRLCKFTKTTTKQRNYYCLSVFAFRLISLFSGCAYVGVTHDYIFWLTCCNDRLQSWRIVQYLQTSQ